MKEYVLTNKWNKLAVHRTVEELDDFFENRDSSDHVNWEISKNILYKEKGK